ncbi:hypothetical protein JCM11491_005944 [Sporobolomyces phaffii]
MLHALATSSGSTAVIVYLVADRKKSISYPEKRVEAFLRGFGSTSEPSFVVEPINGSPLLRITQLLDLYLALESTTSVLLGSLHTNDLCPYLVNLAPEYQHKVTLLDTVTVAPCYRRLGSPFNSSREFESLFGELLTPDVAAKMLWDSVDPAEVGRDRETKHKNDGDDNKDNGPAGGGRDIRSHDATSWRAEDNPFPTTAAPVASTSQTSRLIWDVDSDDDLPAWDPTSQQQLAQFSPPPSPQGTPSPPVVVAAPDPPGPSVEAALLLDSSTSPRVITTRPSTNPLPVRPVQKPAFAAATTTSSSSAAASKPANGKKVKPETITQTPLGPVSSLAAFSVPSLTFSAFAEQPCKRHYAARGGCPQSGQACRFSHEFPFTPQERALFPYWVKGTVCMDAARGKCQKHKPGEVDECYQGHRCPYTNQGCPFGNHCKFRQLGMPHSSRV